MITPAVQARIDGLTRELNAVIDARKKKGRMYKYIFNVLLSAAIFSSIAATAVSVSELPRIIGFIAVIPTIVAIIFKGFKIYQRMIIEYRYLNRFRALRGQLKFGLPDVPSADDVKMVFKSFTETQESYQRERESAGSNFAQDDITNSYPTTSI